MPGICGIVKMSNECGYSISTVRDMASRISFGRSTPNDPVCADGAVFASSSISGTVDHNEPAISEDGKLICVIDGFVFPESFGNGSETFSTTTGTAALLLKRYLADGATVLDGLKGQFSAALWDGLDHSLYLVSDFIGTRNLYYTVANGCFIFSSHLYGFSTVPDFSYIMSEEGLLHYMAFGYAFDDVTLFSNIRLLNSATRLIWRDGRTTALKYWHPSTTIDTGHSIIKPEDALYEVLLSSFKRLRGYGRIHGIGLSGGKDSRVMAGMLSRLDGVSCYGKTYNINIDEMGIAREIARELDIQHEEVHYTETHYKEMMNQCAVLSEGCINTGEFCLLAMQNAEKQDVHHWGWLIDVLTGRTLHHQPYLEAGSRKDMAGYLYAQNTGSMVPPDDFHRALPMARGKNLEESVRSYIDKLLSEISVDELFQYVILLTLNNRQRRRTVRVMSVSSHFTPTLFPFAQEEILDFMLSQPVKNIMAQRLYLKMIVKHFPDLAKYRHPQYPFNLKQEFYLSPYVYTMKKIKRYINTLKPVKTLPGSIDNMYSNYIRRNMSEVRSYVLSLAERRGFLNSDYVTKVLNEHADGTRDSYGLIIKLVTLEQFLRYTVDGETLSDTKMEAV